MRKWMHLRSDSMFRLEQGRNQGSQCVYINLDSAWIQMQIPKLNLTGACLSRKHAPRSHSLTLVTGITKNIASVGPSSGMPERPQELSVTETLQDIDHDMTHHLQTYHSRHWPTSPGVSTGRTMTNQDAHLGRHVQWSHTIQILVVEICTLVAQVSVEWWQNINKRGIQQKRITTSGHSSSGNDMRSDFWNVELHLLQFGTYAKLKSRNDLHFNNRNKNKHQILRLSTGKHSNSNLRSTNSNRQNHRSRCCWWVGDAPSPSFENTPRPQRRFGVEPDSSV